MTDIGLQSLTDWLITTIASIEEMEPQEEDIMKVTIAPNGDVTFDVDDIRDAVAFANQLRDGKTAPAAQEDAKWQAATAHVQSTEDPMLAEAVNLSPALRELYEHLVASDYRDGVSPTELAAAFGIKPSAMDQRLRQLRKKGLTENVARGQWRAAR